MLDYRSFVDLTHKFACTCMYRHCTIPSSILCTCMCIYVDTSVPVELQVAGDSSTPSHSPRRKLSLPSTTSGEFSSRKKCLRVQ